MGSLLDPVTVPIKHNYYDNDVVSSSSSVSHEAKRRRRDSTATTVRKRALIACTHCRTRKVRCDRMLTRASCSNCRLDGETCTIAESRRFRPQTMLRYQQQAKTPVGYEGQEGSATPEQESEQSRGIMVYERDSYQRPINTPSPRSETSLSFGESFSTSPPVVSPVMLFDPCPFDVGDLRELFFPRLRTSTKAMNAPRPYLGGFTSEQSNAGSTYPATEESLPTPSSYNIQSPSSTCISPLSTLKGTENHTNYRRRSHSPERIQATPRRFSNIEGVASIDSPPLSISSQSDDDLESSETDSEKVETPRGEEDDGTIIKTGVSCEDLLSWIGGQMYPTIDADGWDAGRKEECHLVDGNC